MFRVFTLLSMGLFSLIGLNNCSSIPVRVENASAGNHPFQHQHVQINFRGTAVPDREVVLKVAGLENMVGMTDSQGRVIFELDANFQNRAGRIEVRPAPQAPPVSANVVLVPTGQSPVVVDLDPAWPPAETPEPPLQAAPPAGPAGEEGRADFQTARLETGSDPPPSTLPYHEDFSQPVDGWLLGRQSIGRSDVELRLQDGTLVKIIHAFGGESDHILVPFPLPCPPARDLRVSVDMSFQDAFPPHPIGFSIVFRQADNHDRYIARFGEAGGFTLYAYHNGEMAIVGQQGYPAGLTSSPEAFNNYGLVVVGSRISAYINGELIGELVDERISEPGRLALALDGLAGQTARIAIDDLYVTDTP